MRVCVCRCVCMRVCMCSYMCVRICVFVYVCAYVYTYMCIVCVCVGGGLRITLVVPFAKLAVDSSTTLPSKGNK